MGPGSPATNSRLNLAVVASLALHALLLTSFATHGGWRGGGEALIADPPPGPLKVSLRQLGEQPGPPRTEPRTPAGPATRPEAGGSSGGPSPLTPIAATYPESALAMGIAAKVEVRALVDEAGRVEQASVVAATLADVFDRSALEAVRATRFVPATAGGRPVKSTYRAVIFYDIR